MAEDTPKATYDDGLTEDVWGASGHAHTTSTATDRDGATTSAVAGKQ